MANEVTHSNNVPAVTTPNTDTTTEESSGFSVNEPDHEYEVDDAGMLKRAVDNAQKEVPTQPQAKKAAPEKKTLTVDRAPVEMSEEDRDRWAQKGIANEKRWVEIAREKKTLQQQAERVGQLEQKLQGMIEAFEERPMDVLVHRHGREGARKFVEPFLAEEIKAEMMPEHERALRARDQEIALLKGRLGQTAQTEAQTAHAKQVEAEVQGFSNIIIKALNEVGIPKTDFTAAEMADHMHRAMLNKIEYTPERLASLVREDNILRVAALTEQFSKYAEHCYKEQNWQGVIAAGEAMEDILGAIVVKTLRYLDLSRLKAGQPMVPQQILETPRATQDGSGEKKPYMTEDEYATERRRRAQAIDRGEAVTDW